MSFVVSREFGVHQFWLRVCMKFRNLIYGRSSLSLLSKHIHRNLRQIDILGVKFQVELQRLKSRPNLIHLLIPVSLILDVSLPPTKIASEIVKRFTERLNLAYICTLVDRECF